MPLIFFPRVVSPLAAGAGGLDRLAVDAAGTGLRCLTRLLSDHAAERAVDLLPQPHPAPPMEGVADRALGGKVVRQGGPGAARRQQIEDRVEDFPEVGPSRGPRRDRWGHQRFQEGPLGIGQVAGIGLAWRDFHAEAPN